MYDRLEWLTVNQLIVYHALITVYKVRQNSVPEYLASKLKNETRTGRIFIPNTGLVLAQKSFIIRGSITWNSVPESIRHQNKLGIFKKQVKNWIGSTVDRFID